MGNTQSKFEKGMRMMCGFTGGMFGLSDDGYHLGPLRWKENSYGLELNSGFVKLHMKFDKSESGDWNSTIGIGIGLRGRAEFTVEAQKTKEGFTVSPGLCVNVGPVRLHGKIVIDQDLNFKETKFGADGVVYAEVNNTKDAEGQNVSEVNTGVDLGLFKTSTTFNPSDDLEYSNLKKKTNFTFETEYVGEKGRKQLVRYLQRRNTFINKVRNQKVEEEADADSDYCPICKSRCKYKKK